MELSTPIVMGVINVTPDSFSDGSKLAATKHGRFRVSVEKAQHQAVEMSKAGAQILDVGGESTRPGADPVSVQEELDRVIPTIAAIRQTCDISISVDTSTPEVMREACNAGATLINDIRALSRNGAVQAAVETGAAVCLMHTLDEPKLMQQSVYYDDVVKDVLEYLKERVEATTKAGIKQEKLIVDPGFGFGKSVQHNYKLLAELAKFKVIGLPILVGISRKSMIGLVLDKPINQRLAGSLAAAALALVNGANIIRTHDVAATLDVIKVHCAMINAIENE